MKIKIYLGRQNSKPNETARQLKELLKLIKKGE